MPRLAEKLAPIFARPAGRRFVLIRNGQSVANEGGLLCGWLDPRLSVLGRRQARELAREIAQFLPKFSSVNCSDLSRSREFADIVLEFRKKPIPDPRLREIHFGDHEGLNYDLMTPAEQANIDRFDYKAPNGESWGDVRARLVQYLLEKPPGNHLMFTHGGTICALTYGQGIDDILPNASLLALELSENGEPKYLLKHEVDPTHLRDQLSQVTRSTSQ